MLRPPLDHSRSSGSFSQSPTLVSSTLQERRYPDQGGQDLHHGPLQPGHYQSRSLPDTCHPVLHPTQHKTHRARPIRSSRERTKCRSTTIDWACSTSTGSRLHGLASPTLRCVPKRVLVVMDRGFEIYPNSDCLQVEFYIDANGILKVTTQTSPMNAYP